MNATVENLEHPFPKDIWDDIADRQRRKAVDHLEDQQAKVPVAC
jgi:hypothetical protein